MDNTTIEFSNLSIGYKTKGREQTVAPQLTASLDKGEFACLLGPNGSGKTTLLHTLAGKLPVLGGTISVMDMQLKDYKSHHLAQIVSLTTTDDYSIKDKTAWDFVAMGRKAYIGTFGKPSEKDNTMVEKCMKWLNIEGIAQRKMATLSDGERQKVIIAKALAQDTPVMLLDECTSLLDYPNKIAIMSLLHRLAHALGKTILLATHDLVQALQFADRILILDGDKGLVTGMPEDLNIDGTVARYFANERLTYDCENYTFHYHYTTAREVVVKGNANTQEYRMFCRAMMRNGMLPVAPEGEHAADKVQINIPGDGTYRLIEAGKETLQVHKIAHLLGMIVPAITRHKIADIREAAGMNQYE